MMVLAKALEVDFYFDVVCPWCWIGLRQFAQARTQFLAQHPQLQVRVNWRSWPLLPALPRDGVPFEDFYLQRLGSARAVAARRAQILQAGQGIVPPFQFGRIERMPNALAAHRLLAYARQFGDASQLEALLDLLFQAYFIEGRDIGKPAVLCDLGEQVLGTCPGLARWLDDEAGRQSLLRTAILRVSGQIDGVPALSTAGQAPMSGAASADVLYGWLCRAAAVAP